MPPPNIDIGIDMVQRKMESPGKLDLSALGPVIFPATLPSTTSTAPSVTRQSPPDAMDVSHPSFPDPVEESTVDAHFDSDSDSDSGSDYLSFQESEDDEETKEEKEARERERRMVLEAAGLIVQVDKHVKPPPALVRARSLKKREISEGIVGPGGEIVEEPGKEKRRPPPAIPISPSQSTEPADIVVTSFATAISSMSAAGPSSEPGTRPPRPPRRRHNKRSLSSASSMKDLPPIPADREEPKGFDPDEHAKRLDDAFERYESFRNANLGGNYDANRLSVVSGTSTDTSSLYPPSSPTTTMGSGSASKETDKGSAHRRHSWGDLSAHFHGLHSHPGHGKGEESGAGASGGGGSRYSHLFQFLNMSRSKTPEGGAGRKFVISGPMAMNGGEGEGASSGVGEVRSESPAFGSVCCCSVFWNWALIGIRKVLGKLG